MSFQEFNARDIQLDQEHDLVIKNGDFVVELSDDRHVNMIALSAKGNFRFAPTVGVDIFSFLNSVGQDDFIKRAIQEQLAQDGYRINSIDYNKPIVNILAKRIK